MYRPRGLSRRQSTEGGAYISTIQPSSLTTSDITLSTLYYIMSIANITSINALTTLTTAQLDALKRGIDEQIAVDVDIIAANRSTIAGISVEISAPGGLLGQYNTANELYLSSLRGYNLTSTAIAEALSRFSADTSTLSSLYNVSTSYTSTIKSYELEYSTIVVSLQKYASSVYEYEKRYQSDLLELSTNTILYNAASNNLSTISSIVSYDYSTLYNLSLSPQQRSSMSSTYKYDLGLYNQISSQIGSYLITEGRLKGDIADTYYAISSILNISSFLMMEQTSYANTIAYYQSLDDTTESDIKLYSDEISTLTAQIASMQNTNSIILGSIDSEIQTIRSDGEQFFSLYKEALDAECDEYLYGIQEFNSQVGYITASLGIAINANAVAIDNYTFTLIDPNISESLRSITTSNKNTLSNDNGTMNSLIVSINSLDSTFATIVSYITDEKGQKQTFINKRKNIFTNYEVPSIAYSQSQINAIKTEYLAAFADLNNTITTINSDIRQRKDYLKQIQDVTDPLRLQINNFFAKYLGTSDDQLPNALTRVLASDGVTPLGGSVLIPEYTPPDTLSKNAPYSFIEPITF
jgi:hypothetical protein